MGNDDLKTKLQGRFIVIDGPDGCGKTTQSKLLAEWLEKQGITVKLFRDPGTTAISEKIRQILLNPEHIAMATSTEVLLYMAARVQLWQEKIVPALRAGNCVVLDRWLSSTCAYQGYAGDFSMEKVIKIAQDCLDKPWPDLTVILDVDLETASTRLKTQLDRMEQKGDGYHRKVREGFLKLAESAIGADQRKKFIVINAADSVEKVHQQLIDQLTRTLTTNQHHH